MSTQASTQAATQITTKNTPAGLEISIAGDLDFTTASQTLAKLSSLIHRNNPLFVDLSGVRSSNSAGLAVMIESLAIAERQGHKIAFENIPEPLIQLSNVCQVNSLI